MTTQAPGRVPFLDLAAAHAELADELEEALARVLAGGRYVLGPEVEAFEERFAASAGVRHCVGVGCGLDALHLALEAMGVGPGDEVLVPATTYIATWLAVTRVGATVVPVEPRADTGNIDPDLLEAAVTPRTRAVVPVHLHGRPAEMDAIRAVADRHGLRVLEDAAQAHGARHDGRPVGGLGDAAAWSFYPGKNLGALGDGGAVTTDDYALAARVRRLRNYGSSPRHLHPQRGQDCSLIARAGTHFQHAPGRALQQRFGHFRHHIRLRNGLPETNRQGIVFVRPRSQYFVHELMPWHRTNRIQHALIDNAHLAQILNQTIAHALAGQT